ncbi:lipopolysaccharide biosynthesis protein [Aquibacillus sediminis]|uniref:lipopolysaccharide biosynthesis protein n=1 Tax=Aquibacillus sediminis TaxID=2574734 RepID=UPI001108CC40|nr:lipopolysaccharide biosynthesis protein [Aquibacillus sediminis]
MSNENVSSRTSIFGLVWSFTELLSKQGISFLIQIFLARLLLPEHFGLIGMITIFIAFSTSLVQSGLDQALIREKELGQRDYSTVFFFNLSVSIVIYVIIFFTSPFIAEFYNEPVIVEVLRVLMLVVIINAVSVIQRVMLVRKIDFKTQTKISIIASFTSGVVAIVLALCGSGVWSLVAQQVTMQFITMTLLLVYNRWIPSWVFDVVLFKRYFNFGYKLLLSSLINVVRQNIYQVIIGKLYPVAQLGYYTNALKLRDVSSKSLSQALQRVSYPLLSKSKDDNDKLSLNYIRLIRSTAFIHFPLITILAAISPILIPLLLGEQWEPSVQYFQLLCIVGLFYPIQSLNLNILKVIGRTDIFLLLSIIKTVILFLSLGMAITLRTEIEGLIVVAILNSCFALLIHISVTSKQITYKISDQLYHLIKLFISVIVVFIVMNVLRIQIDINEFMLMFLLMFIGSIVYIGISLVINRWELKSTLRLIRDIRK